MYKIMAHLCTKVALKSKFLLNTTYLAAHLLFQALSCLLCREVDEGLSALPYSRWGQEEWTHPIDVIVSNPANLPALFELDTGSPPSRPAICPDDDDFGKLITEL